MEYGLIGAKLGHSYSVPIHAQLGDYDYRLYERTEEAFVELLKRRDFRGLNVTIPYKKLAFTLCDALSDTAREVGSVNTVVVREDGARAAGVDAPGGNPLLRVFQDVFGGMEGAEGGRER